MSFENGIAKKIRSQISVWAEKGHAVRYFALVPNTSVWIGFATIESTLIPRGTSFTRLIRAPKLAAAIREWHPDVIYYRYGHHVAGLPALFQRFPAIAEINSDDVHEYPLSFPLAKRIYHHLTRSRLLGSLAGFVTVTRELGDRLTKFGKPTRTIGNGITLSDYRSPAPTRCRDENHAVFLGSPSAPWHGLDRISELAGLLPAWTVDIIGCDAAEAHVALSGRNLSPNLSFRGHLDRSAYEPLIHGANAGLGTFGLWRKQMNEACPLKVREYLAYGLPVIAAYKDTDISDDADYFLRLPNDASSLAPQVPRINAFLARWKERYVSRSAIAHLDTSVKETARLAFMSEIVGDFRR